MGAGRQRGARAPKELREQLEETELIDGANVFVFWSDNDGPALELYISLMDEVFKSCGLVAVVVLVLSSVLLIHPKVALLVGVALVATVVDTLGFMHYWDVPVNPASYMCVVISIGLSVDYVAQVLHAFILQPEGSKLERAQGSLLMMGAAVVKGASRPSWASRSSLRPRYRCSTSSSSRSSW